MKRLITLLWTFLLLTGCTEMTLSLELTNESITPCTKSVNVLPESSELVFNEDLNSWLVKLYDHDTFELSACQRAYESIVRNAGRLEPTHLALKVIPRDFAQQFGIENDPDLIISYAPFGYAFAPQEENVEPQCHVESESTVIQPEPYCLKSSVPMEELSSTSTLYVAWPAEKSIPQDLDYELCYSIFSPEDSNLPEDQQEELINTLLPQANRLDPEPFHQIADGHLTLRMYDNLLGQYVPLKNVKVTANYYSSAIVKTYYADQNGQVIFPSKYGDRAYCTFILTEPDKFSVRSAHEVEDTSTLVSRGLGWLFTQQPSALDPTIMESTYYTFNRSENLYDIVYLAADYYRNDISLIASDLSNMPHISFVCLDVPQEPGVLGAFYDNSDNNNPPIITITDANQTERNKVVGTTLHELGHYYQFCNRPSSSPMTSLSLFFAESFACGHGNALGEQYYFTKGYVKSNPSDILTGQECQNWIASSYSPLFVDLMDSYNQHTANTSYPNDLISGTPLSTILDMGKEAETLQDIKDIFLDVMSPPYTSANINTQLSCYVSLF